ncbi:MAG: nucleotide sugar dehydrogenase [Bacteroidota bacterium]
MYQELIEKKKKISVIGLGYVGLPLALEFAKKFSVIGFDINQPRVELMKQGVDPSKELSAAHFEDKDIIFTADESDLSLAHFHIVAVPTPVTESKVPNLKPVLSAAKAVGKHLKKGDYVVFESTVYPGCTEEDCLPILEKKSGLKLGEDFKIGYSPERINPGDKKRTIATILKIVSGNDAVSLDQIAKIYGEIIVGGIHKAPTIKVAEAAKVIENTQRDLNISLMNELAIIFDKMGIDTQAVLEAAGTKWNFLKFYPGLVGGHCIGVDPYYLVHKSKQIGYDPQVILSGRRVNDEMPAYVAKRLIKMLIGKNKSPHEAKVLVMGVTFKENVADIRNSKVIDMIKELMQYSINVHITDPHASPNEVAHEYKLTLIDNISSDYDAVVVAVGHDEYKALKATYFQSIMKQHPILMDIKGIFSFEQEEMDYWRL